MNTMNDQNEKTDVAGKPLRKTAQRWPAVRAFLTTASIAATVGGWAMMTLQDQAATSNELAAADTSTTYRLDTDLSPIPTVVPAPSLEATQTTGAAPTAAVTLRSVTIPDTTVATAPAATATPEPTATVAPTPTATLAVPAPAPVTTTHSSRARR